MTTTWLGDRAVLVTTDGPDAREEVARILEHHREALGADTLIRRGMRDVLVEAPCPDLALLERVDAALRDGAPVSAGQAAPAREHRIDVRYGGEDISAAAADLGIGTRALAEAHSEQIWRVAMLGFAPGFGYLEPVGDHVLEWSRLERRSSPRTRVPRGSVAVAAGMSAIYPQDMPGGWHLIGVTAQVLFDPERTAQPSLLAPGDLVRFVSMEQ